jgi:hypothetical protein
VHEYFLLYLTDSTPSLVADMRDSLVQKHIKIQIVSFEGINRIIADISTYYAKETAKCEDTTVRRRLTA